MKVNETALNQRSNLVSKVSDELRHAIVNGTIEVGEKLPSEARLTEQYAVSRTVVREAIAALRSDGLVQPRQGSGIYVISNQPLNQQPFITVDNSRISSVIELLELRTAIEVEAAGLAAQRRSPAQEEAILEALQAMEEQIGRQQPAADADRNFHYAIADATNNARFREFLELMGRNIIPRRILQERTADALPEGYLQQIQREHHLIAETISAQDTAAAREAMRQHLQGSQQRYRQVLRQKAS
ncbi:MAG: FadR/GntR family transcriptional regulator [Thiolinea sp.]